MKKCNEAPPVELYDFLHEMESIGILIPKVIEDWWKRETIINEEKRHQKTI